MIAFYDVKTMGNGSSNIRRKFFISEAENKVLKEDRSEDSSPYTYETPLKDICPLYEMFC